MTPREKVLIGLAGLVIISGLIAYSQVRHSSPEVPQPSHPKTASTAATGNVDNTANALFSQASSEAQLTKDADSDASLLTSDGQEINGLLQAYDETKF